MSTGINNEKQITINICIAKLLLTLIALVSLTGQLTGVNGDKKWVIVIDPEDMTREHWAHSVQKRTSLSQ